MSLQQWLDNSWIKKITTSREAIRGFLSIADREIADASLDGMSPDGKFDHAYSAVRCLCDAALHACGYGASKGSGAHERVIGSLKFSLGDEWAEDVDFLDFCRRRRNQTIYDMAGTVQDRDAQELLDVAVRLRSDVWEWLKQNSPRLL